MQRLPSLNRWAKRIKQKKKGKRAQTVPSILLYKYLNSIRGNYIYGII